jgi:hypothetical protein
MRAAVEAVRTSGETDLAGLKLVTDGRRVWACFDDGQILDALGHGQLALFVAVDRVAAAVDTDVAAFRSERSAFVSELLEPQQRETR